MYFTITLMIVILCACCFGCRSHAWNGYHYLLEKRLAFFSSQKNVVSKQRVESNSDRDGRTVKEEDIEINEIFSSKESNSGDDDEDDLEKGLARHVTLKSEEVKPESHSPQTQTQTPIRVKTFMVSSVKAQRDSHLQAKKSRRTLAKESETWTEVWMANPLSAQQRSTTTEEGMNEE
jgi:hypothetical protein